MISCDVGHLISCDVCDHLMSCDVMCGSPDVVISCDVGHLMSCDVVCGSPDVM